MTVARGRRKTRREGTMKSIALVGAFFAMFLTGASADDGGAAALQELAPTGKLRVGIGVAPVSSAFWATDDPATRRPRGVTVELGAALAQRLGVPVEFLIYNSSGEVTEAGAAGLWDVSFMPVDAERARKVDFGPNYYLFVSTYLVPAGSQIQTLADVDRSGVRVVGVANTTTIRSAERALKQATLSAAKSVDEILDLLTAGKADAVALGRESLESLAPRLPGSRILDGHFHAAGVAVAVPKGKSAALAYVTTFIEEAKTSGVVRRALDGNGIRGAVAPPGSRL
ncbi:MAG: transporter substrate-binding domain-containing protein [Pseudomonadota bacterium]